MLMVGMNAVGLILLIGGGINATPCRGTITLGSDGGPQVFDAEEGTERLLAVFEQNRSRTADLR